MSTHDPSNFYGLDTEHCKGSASAMQQQGQQLGELIGGIQGLLDCATWKGKNAEAFLGIWGQTLKPKMAVSAEQMDTGGAELHERVRRQEQAST